MERDVTKSIWLENRVTGKHVTNVSISGPRQNITEMLTSGNQMVNSGYQIKLKASVKMGHDVISPKQGNYAL